ncbi:MAG: aminotransferase class I/II-fold pyridoxal phosphate-dependent enzyme, partial [Oscillospiraceae bacterium]|nr:aminotransferase class I/II-fold pyridoxal phosphate-dependent enzyme [Oscillospiraceae bacterium]
LDAAYEAFIGDASLPRSIFEIRGAEKCAIEFCSLSKTAGFTGVRASYTVVPRALVSGGESLLKMWRRRQSTKFNQTPYIVQRGLEAAFSPEGLAQCRKNIAFYKANAKIIADTMDELGVYYTGGVNSPYIWLQCPGGMASWAFFDFLLNEAAVVGTPGAGFGKNGEGFFRLTGFGSRENTIKATGRIKKLFS